MDRHHSGGLNWIIGAGIVGADIGTSVFYGTGVLFPIVGYLAPLLILTVCLMMWLFKRTYEEGLALSPYNGGAYSMILRTTGRRLAVVAGSLTVVSYLATASISALSGGFYLSSLVPEGMDPSSVVLLALIPIAGFGLLNSRGIGEPAKLVTYIAGFHFALLLVISIWGLLYVGLHWSEIEWSKFSTPPPAGPLTFSLLMYGLASAFLGITGFESAAQIVEELEQPTMVTVNRLYRAIVLLVSITAPMISFLCLVILSPNEINGSLDFMLSGLADKLGGHGLLYVVVLDATLTLFAAVNTAFVGFIGLATTMAKQGNLPEIILTRVAHKYPSITGYPLVALPFAVIAALMAFTVAGEVDQAAGVYGISFLGVMVSFCLGVVLMRNRALRRGLPQEYLSKWTFQFRNRTLPFWPLCAGSVLTLATAILAFHSEDRVKFLLTFLFLGTLILMAYYRWGVLEKRLENRSDLRLGIGRFANVTDLPETLPTYVLCTGGTGARRLINLTLRKLIDGGHTPFELVIFHAEDGKDPEGFFYELLQRVVSQQISPIYHDDFILSVKILPGSLSEGLHLLKRTLPVKKIILGEGRDFGAGLRISEELSEELELDVVPVNRL